MGSTPVQEQALITRQRHRQHVQDTLQELEQAVTTPHLEVTAEHIRVATQHLGRIVGRLDLEQVLDVLFRDFCIGK